MGIARLKLGIYVGTLGGIALAITLLVMNDVGAIFHVFAQVGTGLIAIVATRAVIITICGFAWSLLLPEAKGLPFAVWPLLRWVREGINVLLPVATIGGEIIGGRLLTFWGVPGGAAAGGILVDILVQAVGQATFALFGILLLARVEGAGPLYDFALGGIGIAFAALLGFFVALRFGGVARAERWVGLALSRWSRSSVAEAFHMNPTRVADGLAAVWRRPGHVAASLGVHILAWLLGTLDIWIALHVTGHHTSLTDALIMESIGQAVRGAAFPVPGALGVQEGGFVLIGQLLGIDPQTAIALSLVKRVPDVVLGLPALFAWHTIESRKKNAQPPFFAPHLG
jgi:putative membrane protein